MADDHKKICIIDLDGTICDDIRNEEGIAAMAKAEPYWDTINAINRLYDDGHFICIFTARTDEHEKVTKEWLTKYGVKYQQIIFNKPRRIGKYKEYHFIDNVHVRATTYKGKGSFTKFVKKTAEVEVFEE